MVKRDIELYEKIQEKAKKAKGNSEYDITKEPLYNKLVEPIQLNTVIVKCTYDMKKITSQKRKEFKKFLREDIPNLWSHNTAKTAEGEDIEVFYPNKWEGQFKLEHKITVEISDTLSIYRNPEIGAGQQYSYLELFQNKAIYVKRLHNLIATKLANNDYLENCEVIWGDTDGKLTANDRNFRDMKGWLEMKDKGGLI